MKTSKGKQGGNGKRRYMARQAGLYSLLVITSLVFLKSLFNWISTGSLSITSSSWLVETIFLVCLGGLLFLITLFNEKKIISFERKATESKTRLHKMTKSLPVGVLAVQKRRCVYANPSAQWLTGFEREKLMGMDILDLFAEEDRPLAAQRLSAPPGDSTGGARDEARLVTADNSYKWVDFSVVKLPAEKEHTVQLILNDQTERKRADLLKTALYRLSEESQSVENIDDLYALIHKTVKLLMEARNFYIAVYDNDTNEISFPYWSDERDPQPETSKLFDGVTSKVIKGDRALIFTGEEMDALRDSGELESDAGGSPANIWMGVPLRAKGSVIGSLCIQDYDDINPREKWELEALEILASQAAIAIHRKREQTSELIRNRRLAENQRVLTEIAAFEARDLDADLQLIADKTAEALRVSRLSIWLLNEETDTLERRASYSDSARGVDEELTIKIEDLQEYFDSLKGKQFISIFDASIDKFSRRLIEMGIQLEESVSRLEAPLAQHGEIIGFILCEDTDRLRKWINGEGDLAASVANITALAVATSKRKEIEKAVRRRDEILVATAELSITLLRGTDLGESLSKALSTLGQALNVFSAHLFELVIDKDALKLNAELLADWCVDESADINGSKTAILPFYSPQDEEFINSLRQRPHMRMDQESLPPALAFLAASHSGRKILVLPLLTKGVCTGFLLLMDRRLRKEWQVEELSILKTSMSSIEGALRRRDAERVAMEREERFRTLAETTSAGIVIYRGSQPLYLNPAAEEIIGLPKDKWGEMDLLDVLTPEFREEMEKRRQERMRGIPGEDRLEFRIVNAKGEELWLSGKGAPITYEGQRAAIMTAFDITDRKRIEEELRQQKSLFQQLFENSPEAIAILDNDEKIIDVNKGFEVLFGWKADEVRGVELNSIVVPAVDMMAGDELTKWVLNKKTVRAEKFRQRKDGSLVPVDIIGYPIFLEGDKVGVFGIYRDISQRKKIENKLYHQAHFDSLTGLPNRNFFMERMTELLSDRKEDEALALLYVDIDRFKEVNDALGHEVGDQLLIKVCKRLMEESSHGSFVARMGSDEFAIIIQGRSTPSDVEKVAERLVEAFQNKVFQLAGQKVSLPISMGISVFPTDGVDTDSLLRHADLSASRVKNKGGDGFMFFRSEMGKEVSSRMVLLSQLRRGLENKEFTAYFQPVIQLAENQMVSMETLVRWNHPDMGLVLPNRFMRVAEESGLIVPMGEGVLNAACIQNKKWQDKGLPPMVISVNFSGRQFRSGNIVSVVKQCLERSALAPYFLEIEITESTAMWDIELTKKVLSELESLGVRIAIDDFGTGYSSFYYLKKFPIHTLKIDQVFVKDVLTNKNDASIIKAIITMCHGLDIRVIAEGVETIGQYEFLRNAGCDAVQGFYFSPALPGRELELFLRSRITPTLGDQ